MKSDEFLEMYDEACRRYLKESGEDKLQKIHVKVYIHFLFLFSKTHDVEPHSESRL